MALVNQSIWTFLEREGRLSFVTKFQRKQCTGIARMTTSPGRVTNPGRVTHSSSHVPRGGAFWVHAIFGFAPAPPAVNNDRSLTWIHILVESEAPGSSVVRRSSSDWSIMCDETQFYHPKIEFHPHPKLSEKSRAKLYDQFYVKNCELAKNLPVMYNRKCFIKPVRQIITIWSSLYRKKRWSICRILATRLTAQRHFPMNLVFLFPGLYTIQSQATLFTIQNASSKLMLIGWNLRNCPIMCLMTKRALECVSHISRHGRHVFAHGYQAGMAYRLNFTDNRYLAKADNR